MLDPYYYKLLSYLFFVSSTEEFSALMISLLIFQATMMPAKLTEQWKWFDGKILYQFMYRVTVSVSCFKLLVLSFNFDSYTNQILFLIHIIVCDVVVVIII